MGFIVILVALALQYYLNFSSQPYRYDWMTPYFRWISSKMSLIETAQPIIAVATIILPLLILVSLVFGLVFHLLGNTGYFVLSLAWLWYALDVRSKTSSQALQHALYEVFSVVFWYYFFGPVGLALYVSVRALQKTLVGLERQSLSNLLSQIEQLLIYLPVRLLGLSFALVGSFSPVMQIWLKKWQIGSESILLEEFASAALDNALLDTTAVNTLIERAAWVWLVVMALVSIGVLIG